MNKIPSFTIDHNKLLRGVYVERLSRMFEVEGSIVPIIITAVVLTVILIAAYNIIVLRTIRSTVEPKKYID